jgi:hypothetical protein
VLDVLPQCKLDAMSPNCVLPTVGAPEPMFQIDQSPYQCQIARALVEDGETLEHDYAVTHYSFKFKAGSVILNVIPLGLPPEHPVPIPVRASIANHCVNLKRRTDVFLCAVTVPVICEQISIIIIFYERA